MKFNIDAYRDLQTRLLQVHGVLHTLSIAHSSALDVGDGLTVDNAEAEYYCILDAVDKLSSCISFLDSLDVVEGGGADAAAC